MPRATSTGAFANQGETKRNFATRGFLMGSGVWCVARIGPHPRPLSIAAAMERGAEMIRLALQQFMVRRRRSLTRMAVGGLLGDRLDTHPTATALW